MEPKTMGKQCVGGILVQGERLLLGRRTPTRAFYPDVWDVFGGHVEAGESLEATLIREFQEELGITPIAFVKRAGWQSAEDTGALQAAGLEAYHLYIVTAWTGVPSNRQPEEHAEIAWLHLAQLQTLPLALDGYLPLFAAILTQHQTS